MSLQVDAVVELAKTWPTEDQVNLLDAIFGLVSPTSGDLETQWADECDDRCAAIDRGEMPTLAAEEVMSRYQRQ